MARELLLVSFVLSFASTLSHSAGQIATKSLTGGETSKMDGGLPEFPAEAKAEVEITGTLKAPMRTKKFMAYVAKHPCDPKLGTKHALRTVAIDPNVSMNFFLEIFVPQGSTGYVCGAGYDERDKLVLFGAYSGNPLTFRGKGEVTFSQVSVSLEPVTNLSKEKKRVGD